MGCFGSKKTLPAVHSFPPLTSFPVGEYPRQVVINIWTDGKPEMISLDLPEPDACAAKFVKFSSRDMKLSCIFHIDCILPGLDPMGEVKLCQDLAFTEVCGELMLLGVFDGHGQWGHRVVRFCQRFCSAFLTLRAAEAATNPKEFLRELCKQCHQEVTAQNSGVNCNLSGSTAILALISATGMHVAAVGDSRAVLGTTQLPSFPCIQQSVRAEDKQLLDRVSCMRDCACPETEVMPLQLSRDQKPDDPSEAKRISASGGEIRKSEDEDGKEGGPMRVWRPGHGYPGIAMSRSIGDVIAHSLGLTADPEITTHRFTAEDRFLVLASDGLWDVMDNGEVCDFIESHRGTALSSVDEVQKQTNVKLNSASIAQLLCEEARTRWLSVAEAEDVVIDDISCIVLEVASRLKEMPRRPQRLSLDRNRRRSSCGTTPESPLTPDTAMFLRRDERRASIMGTYSK